MPNEAQLPPEHLDLLDEISFPDARGGRKASVPLTIAIERPLTPADLATLANRSAAPTGQRLLRIRHSHHLLAQCMARGAKPAEAAAITGYDTAYISALQGDPAFEELLTHYAGVAEDIFVDVMERMKALGISALDELVHRLESEPEEFARRELMELAELMLVKPHKMAAGTGAAAPGSGALTINIDFVGPKPTLNSDSPRLGVIDQETAR